MSFNIQSLIQAVQFQTPGGAGTTDYPIVVNTAVGTTSTAAIALTGSTSTEASAVPQERFFTFCAEGADVYIRFGISTVGAATTDDWLIKDGIPQSFYIRRGHTHFRATATVDSKKLHWAATSG